MTLKVVNTEKGLPYFLTTLKVFNIEKGLNHFHEILKGFNFENWLNHNLMALKVFIVSGGPVIKRPTDSARSTTNGQTGTTSE